MNKRRNLWDGLFPHTDLSPGSETQSMFICTLCIIDVSYLDIIFVRALDMGVVQYCAALWNT